MIHQREGFAGLEFVCCFCLGSRRNSSRFPVEYFCKISENVSWSGRAAGPVSHVKWILNVSSSLHLILIPKMSRHSSAVTGQMLDLFRIFKLNNGLASERKGTTELTQTSSKCSTFTQEEQVRGDGGRGLPLLLQQPHAAEDQQRDGGGPGEVHLQGQEQPRRDKRRDHTLQWEIEERETGLFVSLQRSWWAPPPPPTSTGCGTSGRPPRPTRSGGILSGKKHMKLWSKNIVNNQTEYGSRSMLFSAQKPSSLI